MFDYQTWENEQSELSSSTFINYKFRGNYYGPRIGAKIIKFFGRKFLVGLDGSYSYLQNSYSPDYL